MSTSETNEARVRLWEQLAAQQQSRARATTCFRVGANACGCAELFEETLQRNKALEDEVKELRLDVGSRSVAPRCKRRERTMFQPGSGMEGSICDHLRRER